MVKNNEDDVSRVKAELNRVAHLLLKTLKPVALTALLATSKQGNAKNVQRDDNQPTPVENVENVSQRQLNPIERAYYENNSVSVDDAKQILHIMCQNSIDNFVDEYLKESLEKIPQISTARKNRGLRGEIKAIKQLLGFKVPDNIQGQHCSFSGLEWVKLFSPEVLIDSCINLYTNPALTSQVLSDSKKITKKYIEDSKKLFKTGNIYKKINEYNQQFNPNNDKKIFFCEETNNGGHHFTVIVFDGKDIYRVSLNSPDIQKIKDGWAKNRNANIFEVTDLIEKIIDSEIEKTPKNIIGKISTENFNYLLGKTLGWLSNKRYGDFVVDPSRYQEQLDELQREKNNKYPDIVSDMLNQGNFSINIKKISKNEFEKLAYQNNDISFTNHQTHQYDTIEHSKRRSTPTTPSHNTTNRQLAIRPLRPRGGSRHT